jgi:hypothetical protein
MVLRGLAGLGLERLQAANSLGAQVGLELGPGLLDRVEIQDDA